MTREDELVATVLASFEDTPDPRLREVMEGLVTHLHAFLREVRPTQAEWQRGIDFLTAVGHATDERRQEVILLSDVLGVSMQVVTVNDDADAGATEATVLGPFFLEDSPYVELGGDVAGGAPGQPCWVEGSVRDTEGRPVAGARVEVWEADEEGLYDVQHDDARMSARAHLFTDDAGGFRFWAVTPTPYPIPHDGPVGGLLAATGRSPMRAAHLHVRVTAAGCRDLVTHVFVEGDPLVDHDSVFGVRPSLVRRFEVHTADDPTPDGRVPGRDWSSTRFDVVLAC